jgi:hypothetical protein
MVRGRRSLCQRLQRDGRERVAAACAHVGVAAAAACAPSAALPHEYACHADAELARLQDELVNLQLWVKAKKLKAGGGIAGRQGAMLAHCCAPCPHSAARRGLAKAARPPPPREASRPAGRGCAAGPRTAEPNARARARCRPAPPRLQRPSPCTPACPSAAPARLSAARRACCVRAPQLLVIFEGRDAAGKGGVIKRITEPLNHRGLRVAALAAPTDTERSQWYFQRYVQHLPSGEGGACAHS